ncbi:nitroreductase family protein [Paenibacillus algorifonticola]|uniref:nitroreductase family protein n=1 Tax=Paenibacillus algorifonticola TaxID=684063 RepID=UPI003D28B6FF
MTVQTQLDQSFYQVLSDRRSVRHYDNTAKMTEAEITEILEIAAKAPSSSNMQPWRFLVVTDQELKQQLLPISNNQQQVVDAAAVIVVLGDLEMYKNAEKIYGSMAEAGLMTKEMSESFAANSQKLYTSIPKERLHEVTVFDAGLVSMQIMQVAKAKGYDTVPMGGYDRDKVRALLNIPERYALNILLPIGKASQTGHPSTRLPINDIAFFNKM